MWRYVTGDRARADAVLADVLAPMLNRPAGSTGAVLPIGSAEDCAEKLRAYARAGAQRVFLWPLADERAQLEAFLRQRRRLPHATVVARRQDNRVRRRLGDCKQHLRRQRGRNRAHAGLARRPWRRPQLGHAPTLPLAGHAWSRGAGFSAAGVGPNYSPVGSDSIFLHGLLLPLRPEQRVLDVTFLLTLDVVRPGLGEMSLRASGPTSPSRATRRRARPS